MCALTEPFLPFRPGPGLPETPPFLSDPPSGNRELRGPLCASGRPRASFLLFYSHYSDPAGSSTRCHQPCKDTVHRHQSAWDTGKWPLWARPRLDLGRARSVALVVLAWGTSLRTIPTWSTLFVILSHPHATSQQALLAPIS